MLLSYKPKKSKIEINPLYNKLVLESKCLFGGWATEHKDLMTFVSGHLDR